MGWGAGHGTGRPIPLDVNTIWKKLLQLQQNCRVEVGYWDELKYDFEWNTLSRYPDPIQYPFVLGFKDDNNQNQCYKITHADGGWVAQVKKVNMQEARYEHYCDIITMADFDEFIAHLHLRERMPGGLQSTALVHRCVRLLGARLARLEQRVAPFVANEVQH